MNAQVALAEYTKYAKDFGYGYFDENNLGELVPNVPFLFWSFRYMVGLWFFIALFFPLVWFLARRKTLENYRYILYFSLLLIPLIYLSSELGWAVAEVGRQPWIVYEILPTKVGISATNVTTVASIFFGFLTIFTLLFIAAFRIALHLIQDGPKIEESDENESSDTPSSDPDEPPVIKKPVVRKSPAKKALEEAPKKTPTPRKRTPKKSES